MLWRCRRSPRWYNRVTGITHVTTTLRSHSSEGTPYEAEFLVDAGAIDCLAPSSALTTAGIFPESRRTHEIGFARLALLGQETVAQVFFGPEKAEPILCVVALESLGIMVDPVNQTLERLHAFPLK